MPVAPVSQDGLLARMLDAVLAGDQAAYLHWLGVWLHSLPWTWLVASTLICGVVGGYLGRAQGRFWVGCGWGLLLGPLGWPLAAKRRSRPPRLP